MTLVVLDPEEDLQSLIRPFNLTVVTHRTTLGRFVYPKTLAGATEICHQSESTFILSLITMLSSYRPASSQCSPGHATTPSSVRNSRRQRRHPINEDDAARSSYGADRDRRLGRAPSSAPRRTAVPTAAESRALYQEPKSPSMLTNNNSLEAPVTVTGPYKSRLSTEDGPVEVLTHRGSVLADKRGESDLNFLGTWCGKDFELFGDEDASHVERHQMAQELSSMTPQGFRLPTPELAPMCTEYEFCTCCEHGDEEARINEVWYLARRAKMDAQCE